MSVKCRYALACETSADAPGEYGDMLPVNPDEVMTVGKFPKEPVDASDEESVET